MRKVKPEDCIFILGMHGEKFEFDWIDTHPSVYKFEMDENKDHKRVDGEVVPRALPEKFFVRIRQQEITLEDLRIEFQELETSGKIVFYCSVIDGQASYTNAPSLVDEVTPYPLVDMQMVFKNIERMLTEVYDIKR